MFRRQVLMTGAGALTTSLAGCSALGGSSKGPDPLRWKATVDNRITTFATETGLVAVGESVDDGEAESSAVSAFDAESGERLWRQGSVGIDPAIREPNVDVVGGVVFAMGKERTVALDPADGSVRWKTPRREMPVLGGDGLVVLVTVKKMVVRELQSGAVAWTATVVDDDTNRYPVTRHDSTLLVASVEGTLEGLDYATGRSTFETTTDRPVWPLHHASDGSTVYLGSRGSSAGQVVAVDLAAGKLSWTVETEVAWVAPIRHGDALYAGNPWNNAVTSDPLTVMRLEPSDGTRRWKQQGYGHLESAGDGGPFLRQGSTVTALSTTGAERWSEEFSTSATRAYRTPEALVVPGSSQVLRVAPDSGETVGKVDPRSKLEDRRFPTTKTAVLARTDREIFCIRG